MNRVGSANESHRFSQRIEAVGATKAQQPAYLTSINAIDLAQIRLVRFFFVPLHPFLYIK
jgi:hypothetical protein